MYNFLNIIKATENFKPMNCRMCKLYPNKVVKKESSRGAHSGRCAHFRGSEEMVEECSATVVPVVRTKAGYTRECT